MNFRAHYRVMTTGMVTLDLQLQNQASKEDPPLLMVKSMGKVPEVHNSMAIRINSVGKSQQIALFSKHFAKLFNCCPYIEKYQLKDVNTIKLMGIQNNGSRNQLEQENHRSFAHLGLQKHCFKQ